MKTSTSGTDAGVQSSRRSLKSVLTAAGSRGHLTHRPLRGFDAYLAGFCCDKHDVKKQRETHTYCKQVSDDLLQCAIFDADSEEANLVGVEYVVSERLFEALPIEERATWHPHNYEILSGHLVAPGLAAAAEKALLKMLMNSYGKAWMLWENGGVSKDGDIVPPVGPAQLLWSFNRDGQVDAGLERVRNERLGVNLMEKRRERDELVPLAKPQDGVDALTSLFREPQRCLSGVQDRSSRSGETGS